MRRLIVGDIHGCWAELQDLLDEAGLAGGDEIIAIGDLVDRGPDSARVVEFFRSRPGARSILGNHERRHVRALRGEVELALSHRLARRQLGDSYVEAVGFMATLPLFLELPEAILAHGFWEPGVPLAEQKEAILVGTMSGESYLSKRHGRAWWGPYDGPKPLIVGHHDYMHDGHALIHRERVFGIDTGCCYGGALTGLVLPEFRVVSVRSRANHWGRLCAEQREEESEDD